MHDFTRMNDPIDFRELLLAYLLDELSVDVRERIEHQMLVDDDYSAALKEAEYDLLDSYASAELSSEQRDRVYWALIAPKASPTKADESRRLLRHLAESGPVGARADGAPQMRPKPAMRWAWIGLAAALIIAAGVTVSLEYHTRQRHEVANGSDQAKPADASAAAKGIPKTAGRSENHATLPLQPLLDAAVLTLVLPETTRGQAALTARLLPETRFVRVEWPGASALSSSEGGFLRLQVADEQRVLTTVTSARSSNRSHGVAVFRVPVKGLIPGSYLFRIVGAAPPDGTGALQVYAESPVAVTY